MNSSDLKSNWCPTHISLPTIPAETMQFEAAASIARWSLLLFQPSCWLNAAVFAGDSGHRDSWPAANEWRSPSRLVPFGLASDTQHRWSSTSHPQRKQAGQNEGAFPGGTIQKRRTRPVRAIPTATHAPRALEPHPRFHTGQLSEKTSCPSSAPIERTK